MGDSSSCFQQWRLFNLLLIRNWREDGFSKYPPTSQASNFPNPTLKARNNQHFGEIPQQGEPRAIGAPCHVPLVCNLATKNGLLNGSTNALSSDTKKISETDQKTWQRSYTTFQVQTVWTDNPRNVKTVVPWWRAASGWWGSETRCSSDRHSSLTTPSPAHTRALHTQQLQRIDWHW